MSLVAVGLLATTRLHIAVSEELLKTFSAVEIRQAQQDISQIIQCKLNNKKPAGHDLNALSNQSKCLLFLICTNVPADTSTYW